MEFLGADPDLALARATVREFLSLPCLEDARFEPDPEPFFAALTELPFEIFDALPAALRFAVELPVFELPEPWPIVLRPTALPELRLPAASTPLWLAAAEPRPAAEFLAFPFPPETLAP